MHDTSRTGWLLPSLRGYSLSWLPNDVIAALTLAAIAIPEQLATARLVGMPPTAGLLAFAAGSFAFATFGTNRFMSVGADSTIAPIMASTLAMMGAAGTAQYAGTAGALALLIGLALLFAGLVRAGWIADLISVPVTTGFLAGISVHIIVGQLPTILGLEAPQGQLLGRLGDILQRLPNTKPYPVAIAVGVLAIAVMTERFKSHVPGALIGLVASGLAVWMFGLDQRVVTLVGPLPIELPLAPLQLPTWLEFSQLLPP